MSNLWGLYFKKLDILTEGKTSTEDLDYAVHISLKNKYIFVETPKVACSTIKKTLQRLELDDPYFDREYFENLHVREFSPLLKMCQLPNFENYFERDDYTTFCFVRNPYSRILSCYIDKVKQPLDFPIFKIKVLQHMGMSEEDIDYSISFEEFITVIEKQTFLEMDYHWRPQAYLTCQNQIKYDYIGRLENFSEDFYTIGRKLSPDFKAYYVLELRHQTKANNLLDKYYTNDLYNRVYNIYKMDFETFSYNK